MTIFCCDVVVDVVFDDVCFFSLLQLMLHHFNGLLRFEMFLHK